LDKTLTRSFLLVVETIPNLFFFFEIPNECYAVGDEIFTRAHLDTSLISTTSKH